MHVMIITHVDQILYVLIVISIVHYNSADIIISISACKTLLEKRVLKCHEKCLNNLSGNA